MTEDAVMRHTKAIQFIAYEHALFLVETFSIERAISILRDKVSQLKSEIPTSEPSKAPGDEL